MSKEITEADILDALRAVSFNGDSLDLVESGKVSGVVIKDSNVAFSIEINPDEQESIKPLAAAAEAAVLKIKQVSSATAMLTAHQKQSSNTPESTQQGRKQHEIHQPAKHIIAVASGKGGVGKSTTAVNLALGLQALGHRVAILDADIYGPSLPRLLGINRKPTTADNKIIPLEAFGLKVMSIGFLVDEDAPTIWRGPMVMSALEQMLRDVAWGDPDILIIDMPPGTGDAQLTLSQRAQLAGAVIVSTPQDLALIDARKGLNMFHKVNVPVLGIVENMSYFVCPSCGEQSHIFGHGGAEAEATKLGLPFLGKVPLEIEIRTNSDAGTPIVASKPESTYASIYRDIAAKVFDNLSATTPSTPKITIA